MHLRPMDQNTVPRPQNEDVPIVPYVLVTRAIGCIHHREWTTAMTDLPDLPELRDDSTPWTTDLAETALLRALTACRCTDVLTLCEDKPTEAVYHPARRLILQTIIEAAETAVAAGEGDLFMSPATVLARVQATPGPVAVQALRDQLPEVLFGRPLEQTVTPAVWEVPDLWRTVQREHLLRECRTYAGALAAAVTEGDVHTVLHELGRLRHLQDLAAPVQDATTERSAA